jgi:hypothetical protein
MPYGHQQRRIDAMNNTIKYLEEVLYPKPSEKQNEDAEDDSEASIHDSDEDEDYGSYKRISNHYAEQLQNRTAMIDMYKTFLQALPNCTPLDLGFIAVNTFLDAEKFCWCPCQNQLRFTRWRMHFGVDDSLPNVCTSNGKFTPNGLLKHLEAKKYNDDVSILTYQRNDERENAVLHTLVYKYLKNCYENYTEVPRTGTWLHHKALYDVGNTEYKRAEAAQNAWLHR